MSLSITFRTVVDERYICIAFLRSQCLRGDECDAIHYKKPYQWQWFDSCKSRWESFSCETNDEIEKCYVNDLESSQMTLSR